VIDRSADRLLALTRELVEAIRADADHLVGGLIRERAAALDTFSRQLSQGEPPSADEARELQRLDRELLAHVTRRRDEIGAELVVLHRGRRAGHAYADRDGMRPRYLDRAT
jgi:hypothetical protein